MSEKGLLGTRVITQIGLLSGILMPYHRLTLTFLGLKNQTGSGQPDMTRLKRSFTENPVKPEQSLPFLTWVRCS